LFINVLTAEHSIPQWFLEVTAPQPLVSNKETNMKNSEVAGLNESPRVGNYPVFSCQRDVLVHNTDEYNNQYLYNDNNKIN
jgi:hypothetical protein